MLIAYASEHVLSGPATVLLILCIWGLLGGIAFIPWRRIFSRDFWTHPTIAEMQAEMLRNIPAIHAHRKLARRIDKVNRRVLGDAHDLIAGMYGYESDLDRITRLWAPTARQSLRSLR